ncbi:cytosol aminopeptidase-like [Lycorma delicatula]|uniref:cytosol aminopeptidase-like n=1 Tax=Lycorma delicatula TaxID=130591 RepID=UPI003F51A8BD
MALKTLMQLAPKLNYWINSKRYLRVGNVLYHHPFGCGERAALILGVHQSEYDATGESFTFTKTAQKFNEKINGKLREQVLIAPPTPKSGEGKVFFGLDQRFVAIAVVGIGDDCIGFSSKEQMDERKEAIRTAAGLGVRMFERVQVQKIYVESFNHAESAAEGASMASWIYQDLKSIHKRRYIKKLDLFDSNDFTGWKIGLHKAAAQNFTRLLQETPGNNLTPSAFAQTAIETLSKYGISVNVRMQNWAKLRNLNAFLAVGKGSCEPPVLLEVLYEGCNPNVAPIVMIGKGVTFNSGGLCIMKPKEMKHARGDMAGAAAIVATLRAIAALQLPINVRGLIPLCVNVPGASSYKPGDIIRAYNGKTILVEDTNCEGLLMHADALSYAGVYCPKFILDIGTLSADMIGAFGNAASGVWTNNDSLYEMMRMASIHTGDRIWRFPLWDHFKHYMHESNVADYINKTPRLIGGGGCKAAAFLSHFVPKNVDWIHLDITNVSTTDGSEFTYLRKGMSGRPTRNLIEFLAQFSCRAEESQRKCKK